MNETKQRNRIVTAWLWIVIAVNFITAACYIFTLFEQCSAADVIGVGSEVITMMLAALSAVLILKWNKLGFFLFVVTTLIFSLIDQFYVGETIVIALINVVTVIFLCFALQIKKDGRSAWSLMKKGVDYRHCRHIYQLFGGLIAIGVSCTLIAALTINKPDEAEIVPPVLDETLEDSTKVDNGQTEPKDEEPISHNDGRRKSKDNGKKDETPKLLYDQMSVEQLWEVLKANNKDAEALYRLAKHYHKRDIASDPKVVDFWKMTLLPEGDVQRCLPSGKRELTSVRFVFVMLARSYAHMSEDVDPKLRQEVVEMLDSIMKNYSGYRYK